MPTRGPFISVALPLSYQRIALVGPHGIEPCPTALQAAVRTSYTRDPKFGGAGWIRTTDFNVMSVAL